MELDWTTERVGDVTLVRVYVANERAVERAVRLRNLLDGPVLPPRRQREPAAGWDRDGVTATVPAGSSVARGYACPAPAAEPPVEIAAVGPPNEVAGTEEPVREARRHLGDARPPRAVLGDTTPTCEETPIARSNSSGRDDAEPVGEGSDGNTDGVEQRELPPRVADVLAPYRRRVETVEALGLASVPEAAELLETTSGLTGVERSGERLKTDAETLRTLATESAALAARAEAAAPPLDALRRLS